MDAKIHEIGEGTVCSKGRPPLDVRIVARLFYVAGSLGVLYGILLCSGVIEPEESYRVLLGAVVLANGLTQGVYYFLTGLVYLFCDWGLMRGKRFVWWFLTVLSVYYLMDAALQFPRGRITYFAIGMAIQISFITWLWFRRGLYGVTLAAGSTRE